MTIYTVIIERRLFLFPRFCCGQEAFWHVCGGGAVKPIPSSKPVATVWWVSLMTIDVPRFSVIFRVMFPCRSWEPMTESANDRE